MKESTEQSDYNPSYSFRTQLTEIKMQRAAREEEANKSQVKAALELIKPTLMNLAQAGKDFVTVASLLNRIKTESRCGLVKTCDVNDYIIDVLNMELEQSEGSPIFYISW